jgi:hypothetical protein
VAAADTAPDFAVVLADVAWATVSVSGLVTKDVVAAGFAVDVRDATVVSSSRRITPSTESATATTFGAFGV